MDAQQATSHSLRYREVAADAWEEVVRPYVVQHRAELLDCCFYAVGSSVAYGLADEHSDIDTVLVLPEQELEERREEWVNWTYQNPELLAFGARHGAPVNVKATTWRMIGAEVLFSGEGDWQGYYEGHHHFVSTLISIYDPQGCEGQIARAIAGMPTGLAEAAAARLSGELVSMAADFRDLQHAPRFAGLFGYSIVARALPLLFHRAGAPLPFHKWQWPLAERLGPEAAAVLSQLRRLLERQHVGDEPFPEGLTTSDTPPLPWRVLPPPLHESVRPPSTAGPLSPDLLSQMLASLQWHLEERGCYQMVRALARGWRHEALHYLCATRCLLIKGAVLLETGRLPLGKGLPKDWEEARAAILGLEGCLWPEADYDPIAKALEAIGLLRAHLRSRGALPEQYLERPLWSPPSYHLACVLEEP
jgi:hypothetical protein